MPLPVRNPVQLQPERIASLVLAQALGAFKECHEDIQAVVLDMAAVYNAADATNEEREAALSTIMEALYPTLDSEGHNNEDTWLFPASDTLEHKEIFAQLHDQQVQFAARLHTLLEERNWSVSDLAAAIGRSEETVQLLLDLRCYPLQKTVHEIATALKVSSEELWQIGDSV